MIKSNQKGQAFSTFKLLIAAVVAIAILAILLPMLNIIPTLGQDPNQEATNTIKSMYNRPSEHKLSQSISFNPEASLNAKSIAQGTGLITADQVCLDSGSKESFFYSSLGGKIITFNGGSAIKAKLSVICDEGNALAESVGAYTDLSGAVTSGWQSSCGCLEQSSTCCLVVVRND